MLTEKISSSGGYTSIDISIGSAASCVHGKIRLITLDLVCDPDDLVLGIQVGNEGLVCAHDLIACQTEVDPFQSTAESPARSLFMVELQSPQGQDGVPFQIHAMTDKCSSFQSRLCDQKKLLIESTRFCCRTRFLYWHSQMLK